VKQSVSRTPYAQKGWGTGNRKKETVPGDLYKVLPLLAELTIMP
jgi:hypothetical protein